MFEPSSTSFGVEWLEADGLGGFSSGTVTGIRTRRYHALLLAATEPPAGRVVLVNGLDAEIVTDQQRYGLTAQRYLPGVTSPVGVTQASGFTTEPWPTWTFSLGTGQVVQEIFVPRGESSVVIRWRWEGPVSSPLKLRVRPFFSGRDFHALHQENAAFNFQPQSTTEGELWHFYPNVPRVLARSNGVYTHRPVWYRQFLYEEERARGLDSSEDLAAPGIYEFDLASGPAVLIFSAQLADEEAAPSPLQPAAVAEQLSDTEKARRATFLTPHHRSADAYLVRRGQGRTIIAGYPWFGDWGRDTFISMRGLCLATGRIEEAGQILTAWAGTVSEGMLPNRFPDAGETLEYNSVDASLWYIVAVHEYLRVAGRDLPGSISEALFTAVDAILTGYSEGTRYQIRADTDGLLACGQPGMQLTWMDAKVDDWVVTPRIGKPVEIQALWLNALAFAGRRQPHWQTIFARGVSAFHDRFWNESLGCLYDVVDVDHQPGRNDATVRPNQIFAAGGLPLPLLDGERASRMVQFVEQKLWTPMGLRSLSPDDAAYIGRYFGDRYQRDGAYHQGTVWPWLTGAFVEAWVHTHGDSNDARVQARQRFLPPLDSLNQIGLNHVPEIADGDAPHAGRGCPFQAWSLGELLRLQYRVLVS